MSQESQPVDVVATLYQRLSGSERQPRHVFSKDVRWFQAESHPFAAPDGPWEGLDALRKGVMEPIAETFEGWDMELDELVPAAGGRVVAMGRYVGTHRASDRRLSAQFCIVYTVSNGQIVEAHQYVDTARIRDVMSLGPVERTG
jgi:ketosteroid isomerase-like protein